MPNKSDDKLYDEILEDSFEDDGSYDSEYADDLEQFDDFDDLDSMPDDTIEEPWDNNLSAEPAFDEKLLKKERKSLNLSFNTIMIIGAVVVGGIFLVYNVMSSKPSGTIGQRFASSLQFTGATDDVIYGENQEDPSQTLPDEKPSNSADQATLEEKGFLFEPDVLDSMEMNLDETNLEQTSPPLLTEKESVPTLDVSEDTEFIDILQPTQPATNTPRAPEIKASEKITEEKVEIIEAPIVPEQDKIAIASEPEEYVVVKQTQVEPPVEEVVLKEGPNINTSSLENKLDLIVSRLDAMEEKIEGVQSSNDRKIDEISATLVELDQKINKVQSAPVKQAVAKKAPVLKATTSAPKKVIQKTPTAPVVSKSTWELRAAQPGKAWVSRGGQKEMQAVMVGDNLEGIGRINAISFNNGRWLVQGSSGQIRQ